MLKNPNIVYILVDDLGYGDLSSYGAQDVKTPVIDKLASEVNALLGLKQIAMFARQAEQQFYQEITQIE